MTEHPWFKFYDEGVPKKIDYPQINLHNMLTESARAFPQRACTIFKGAQITYAEMDALSDRLAAGLADLGVRKGTPVGMFMVNLPQFVLAFYAILKAGGVVVAFNPLYKAREIVHQVNDSGIEIMITVSMYYEKVKAVREQTTLKTLVVTNLKEGLPGLLRVLFSLTMEKKGGHRVTLDEGDVWMRDLIDKHIPEDAESGCGSG